MITTTWSLLAIALVTQIFSVTYADVPDTLEWPEKYTIQAQRVSLTDNIVENYVMWRTVNMSRIDYNGGYVISIVNVGDSESIKFSIHPVATLDQEEETACTPTDEDVELESILPGDLYGYDIVVKLYHEHQLLDKSLSAENNRTDSVISQVVINSNDSEKIWSISGNETMNYKEAVKFSFEYISDNTESRNTIWAIYNDTELVWIPLRYEVLDYNVWTASKEKHEIWNFYDYSTSFSSATVFDIESYGCLEEKTTDVKAGLTENLFLVNPDKDSHVNYLFEQYKKDFSKQYVHENEHKMRRSIFKQNMRRVISHNRRNLGYKLTLNHFADKTPEEMNKYLGLKRRPAGKAGNVPFPYDEGKIKGMVDELPTEYDARLLGLVSEVKNQEQCGSCWTFGTTAAVEGALARVNGGKLLALSNQALIDCAWPFGAEGCDGGTDNEAYEWMMVYGLPTVAEYGSYADQEGICNINNMTDIYPIRGYTDVTPVHTEATKIALVNHGPLSVSVHATDNFQLYSSGIFYDTICDPQTLNHEVTLVGYGERDGETFWILKNSWGTAWGIGGYMFISARDNNCGITTEPTYVVF